MGGSPGPEPDGSFEVERIVSERTAPWGGLEYLVKWRGFGDIENTWQPEEALTYCKKVVRAWHIAGKKASLNRGKRGSAEAEQENLPDSALKRQRERWPSKEPPAAARQPEEPQPQPKRRLELSKRGRGSERQAPEQLLEQRGAHRVESQRKHAQPPSQPPTQPQAKPPTQPPSKPSTKPSTKLSTKPQTKPPPPTESPWGRRQTRQPQTWQPQPTEQLPSDQPPSKPPAATPPASKLVQSKLMLSKPPSQPLAPLPLILPCICPKDPRCLREKGHRGTCKIPKEQKHLDLKELLERYELTDGVYEKRYKAHYEAAMRSRGDDEAVDEAVHHVAHDAHGDTSPSKQATERSTQGGDAPATSHAPQALPLTGIPPTQDPAAQVLTAPRGPPPPPPREAWDLVVQTGLIPKSSEPFFRPGGGFHAAVEALQRARSAQALVVTDVADAPASPHGDGFKDVSGVGVTDVGTGAEGIVSAKATATITEVPQESLAMKAQVEPKLVEPKLGDWLEVDAADVEGEPTRWMPAEVIKCGKEGRFHVRINDDDMFLEEYGPEDLGTEWRWPPVAAPDDQAGRKARGAANGYLANGSDSAVESTEV